MVLLVRACLVSALLLLLRNPAAAAIAAAAAITVQCHIAQRATAAADAALTAYPRRRHALGAGATAHAAQNRAALPAPAIAALPLYPCSLMAMGVLGGAAGGTRG